MFVSMIYLHDVFLTPQYLIDFIHVRTMGVLQLVALLTVDNKRRPTPRPSLGGTKHSKIQERRTQKVAEVVSLVLIVAKSDSGPQPSV
jgi:hypothetical protein